MFLKLLEILTVSLEQLVLYLHFFFSQGILFIYIHFRFMHLAFDKINTLYATSRFFFLLKKEEKCISKLHFFTSFFFSKSSLWLIARFQRGSKS